MVSGKGQLDRQDGICVREVYHDHFRRNPDAHAERNRLTDRLTDRLADGNADREADRFAVSDADRTADRLANGLANGIAERIAERISVSKQIESISRIPTKTKHVTATPGSNARFCFLADAPFPHIRAGIRFDLCYNTFT